MANEKRLIDANALLEKISEVCKEHFCFRSYQYVREFVGDISDAVRKAPTVDAVEVVHGRWIPYYYDECPQDADVKCSNCGVYEPYEAMGNYCPNCGAKMDGDGNG